MGTTPTYSWPYPEDTDPVANGAQDIEDLALAVETTVSGLTQGKILQVVRATDTTSRTTTSTSFVDANISVTITPTSATSTILVMWLYQPFNANPNDAFIGQVTDSSNVALSGAEASYTGTTASTRIVSPVTVIGYSAPATTSATTYKARFRSEAGGSQTLRNNIQTGQLFALEVSA